MADPATTTAAPAKAKTKSYRVVGTHIMLNRKLVARGELVELTDEQAKRIGKQNLRPPSFKWPPKPPKPVAKQRLTNNLPPPRDRFDREVDEEDEDEALDEAV